MDAEAILEANRCGEIRPVPVKTSEQQALLALHRIRTQWQTARVARINTMRALLREHGHAIPVGARTVLGRVTAILEDADAEVPGLLRQVLALVVDEVRALEVKIDGVDRQLAQLADAHLGIRIFEDRGNAAEHVRAPTGIACRVPATARHRVNPRDPRRLPVVRVDAAPAMLAVRSSSPGQAGSRRPGSLEGWPRHPSNPSCSAGRTGKRMGEQAHVQARGLSAARPVVGGRRSSQPHARGNASKNRSNCHHQPTVTETRPARFAAPT